MDGIPAPPLPSAHLSPLEWPAAAQWNEFGGTFVRMEEERCANEVLGFF